MKRSGIFKGKNDSDHPWESIVTELFLVCDQASKVQALFVIGIAAEIFSILSEFFNLNLIKTWLFLIHEGLPRYFICFHYLIKASISCPIKILKKSATRLLPNYPSQIKDLKSVNGWLADTIGRKATLFWNNIFLFVAIGIR